jgi:hypothetical protein
MKQEYVAAVKASGRFYFPIPESLARMLNVRDADLFKPVLMADGAVQFQRVDDAGGKS